MNTDNITSLKGNNNIASQAQSITLHSVLGIIENWRANKKTRGDKIPSEVWDGIFVLLKTIPESRVLVALRCSSGKSGLTSQKNTNNLKYC